jgi:hypothetical protein
VGSSQFCKTAYTAFQKQTIDCVANKNKNKNKTKNPNQSHEQGEVAEKMIERK